MKYSVLKCINGNFFVDSEFTDVEKAIVKFHDVCKNLWNASDVISATVKVVDSNLENYFNYIEHITHTPIEVVEE